MVRRWLTRFAALSAVVEAGLLIGLLLTLQQAACVSIVRVDWDLQKFVKFDTTSLWIGNGRAGVVRHAVPVEPTVKQTDWTIAFANGAPPVDLAKEPITLLVPIALAAVLPLTWFTLKQARPKWWTNAPRYSWRRSFARGMFVMSLFALVVSILFCIRSYPYFERFDLRLTRGVAAVQVNSSLGSLMLAWTESGPNHTLGEGQWLFVRSTIPPERGPLYKAAELIEPFSQALGFSFGSDGTTELWRNVLIVPYWFVILALGIATLLCGRWARRCKPVDPVDQGFEVKIESN